MGERERGSEGERGGRERERERKIVRAGQKETSEKERERGRESEREGREGHTCGTQICITPPLHTHTHTLAELRLAAVSG